jgi:hypothetical protein
MFSIQDVRFERKRTARLETLIPVYLELCAVSQSVIEYVPGSLDREFGNNIK